MITIKRCVKCGGELGYYKKKYCDMCNPWIKKPKICLRCGLYTKKGRGRKYCDSCVKIREEERLEKKKCRICGNIKEPNKKFYCSKCTPKHKYQ